CRGQLLDSRDNVQLRRCRFPPDRPEKYSDLSGADLQVAQQPSSPSQAYIAWQGLRLVLERTVISPAERTQALELLTLEFDPPECISLGVGSSAGQQGSGEDVEHPRASFEARKAAETALNCLTPAFQPFSISGFLHEFHGAKPSMRSEDRQRAPRVGPEPLETGCGSFSMTRSCRTLTFRISSPHNFNLSDSMLSARALLLAIIWSLRGSATLCPSPSVNRLAGALIGSRPPINTLSAFVPQAARDCLTGWWVYAGTAALSTPARVAYRLPPPPYVYGVRVRGGSVVVAMGGITTASYRRSHRVHLPLPLHDAEHMDLRTGSACATLAKVGWLGVDEPWIQLEPSGSGWWAHEHGYLAERRTAGSLANLSSMQPGNVAANGGAAEKKRKRAPANRTNGTVSAGGSASSIRADGAAAGIDGEASGQLTGVQGLEGLERRRGERGTQLRGARREQRVLVAVRDVALPTTWTRKEKRSEEARSPALSARTRGRALRPFPLHSRRVTSLCIRMRDSGRGRIESADAGREEDVTRGDCEGGLEPGSSPSPPVLRGVRTEKGEEDPKRGVHDAPYTTRVHPGVNARIKNPARSLGLGSRRSPLLDWTLDARLSPSRHTTGDAGRSRPCHPHLPQTRRRRRNERKKGEDAETRVALSIPRRATSVSRAQKSKGEEGEEGVQKIEGEGEASGSHNGGDATQARRAMNTKIGDSAREGRMDSRTHGRRSTQTAAKRGVRESRWRQEAERPWREVTMGGGSGAREGMLIARLRRTDPRERRTSGRARPRGGAVRTNMCAEAGKEGGRDAVRMMKPAVGVALHGGEEAEARGTRRTEGGGTASLIGLYIHSKPHLLFRPVMPSATFTDVESALLAPPSASDGRGAFYGFRIGKTQSSILKLGRAKEPRKRRSQWARQCRGERHCWLPYYWEVPFYKKFEKIIHYHFKAAGAWVVPHRCRFCTVRHQEKFGLKACGGVRGLVRVVEYYLGRLNWPVISRWDACNAEDSGNGGANLPTAAHPLAIVDCLRRLNWPVIRLSSDIATKQDPNPCRGLEPGKVQA
ncbi:hypothetical protein B0H11DRAFT_1946271, partial [Mycena galericulata]